MSLLMLIIKRPKFCKFTMMTFRTDDTSSCGIVSTNQNKVLENFIEKPKNSDNNLANGAVYILSSYFLRELEVSFKKNTYYDFSTDIIPLYKKQIYTFETLKKFIDIGEKEKLIRANNL